MSRLQTIKSKTEKVGGYTLITIDDIDWLIEQSEKVEKLQKMREIVANAHQETLEKKDKEIELLRTRGDEAIGEAGKLWTKIFHAKEALK